MVHSAARIQEIPTGCCPVTKPSCIATHVSKRPTGVRGDFARGESLVRSGGFYATNDKPASSGVATVGIVIYLSHDETDSLTVSGLVHEQQE